MSGKHKPKPCNDCGVAPKVPGQGKRYCAACSQRRLSLVEQAEIARGKTRAAKARADRAARGLSRHFRDEAPEGTKWCPSCEEYQPAANFPARKHRKDGLAAYCRPCQSNYYHGRRLETVFDLTADQYAELLRVQDGRCAICERRPRKRRLAVDHDHKTGAIRGLLCTNCNHKILGAAHEDPAILRRAAWYLENPPSIAAGYGEPDHD